MALCGAIVVLAACSGHAPLHVGKLELKEKDDAYLHFIRADLLAIKGETRKSTAELLKLTEQYPAMAYFHLLLAQNFAQEKRFEQAVDSANTALELEPNFVEARLFLGKLEAVQERHADAARELTQALRDDPKREDIYPVLANEYVALRDYGRAVEVLRRLVEVNPDAVIAYYYLGTIHEQYLHRSGEALRYLQEALTIDPANVGVHNAIAEIYLRQKQPRKALAKYQEIAHLEPDEVAVQLRIALIYYELKEFPAAIDVFERILAKNPDADKIRFYLGVLYESAKDPEHAVAEFVKVPPKSSYFKDARIHVASLMRQQGRPEDAVEALREAIEQKAQLPEFYEYLAAIFEEDKQYQQAIDVLLQGHEALPDEEKIVFLLGILYEKVEDRDAAIAAMQEVLRINPQNASALNYIGYTYAERGERLEEALALVQKALVLRPDDGYIVDSLGWVYLRMGDAAQALKYLQRACRLVAGEPTILFHLGEVQLARGDARGARRAFEQALEAGMKKREPDERELSIIRKRLEDLKGMMGSKAPKTL